MKDSSHHLAKEELLEYARALHDYPPEKGFCLDTFNACIERTGLQAVPQQGARFQMKPIPT